MKKIILSTFTLCLTGLFAQTPITLTSSDAPMVGSRTLNVNNLTNLFSVSVGNAGTNETFDFSWFPNDNQDSINYLNLSETNFTSEFSNVNLVSLQLPDTTFLFLNSTSSKIELQGMVMTIPMLGNNILVKASDPVTQINFPVNYMDNFTDAGTLQTPTMYFPMGLPSGTIPLADTAYIDSIRADINISRNSVIDSWGTLVTPSGSFNVLRQKAIDITLSSPEFYLTTVFFGFSSSAWQTIPGFEYGDTTTTYFYYTNATSTTPSLVAQVQEDAQGTPTAANYAVVYNPAGIIETDNNIVSEVYPNPATEAINIKALAKIETVNVYTEDGKLIFNRNIHSENVTINTSSFKTGVYFVEVLTPSGREVKRFSKI